MTDLARTYSAMRPLQRARLAQSDPKQYSRLQTEFRAECARLSVAKRRAKTYADYRALNEHLRDLRTGAVATATLDTTGRILAYAADSAPAWRISAHATSNRVLDIDIHDDIGQGLGSEGTTSKQIVNILRDSTASIVRVHINSRGGDVEEGIGIYNRLRAHGARIETYVDGIAASIASVIAMAGDVRVMYSSARMMVHDPWTFTVGGAEGLRKKADVLEKVRDQMVDIYASHTKRSKGDIKDLMAAETWMNAEEAVLHGFADRVQEHRRIA